MPYFRSGKRRVTLISHSMGGLFGLYFLQQQTQDWKDRHINKFIPLNTPWRGAVIQLNTYARWGEPLVHFNVSTLISLSSFQWLQSWY